MLDLTTAQDSRGLVAIKVMSVYLGVLIASMFLLPNGIDPYPSEGLLTWRWSYLTSEDSFLLEVYFDGNIGFAAIATIIEFIPDIVGVVLLVVAITKMAILKKKAIPKSIWHSGIVLGAIFYNLAKVALSSALLSSNFLSYALSIGWEYAMSQTIYLLLFSQDELILCILALYMALFALKNYRYP